MLLKFVETYYSNSPDKKINLLSNIDVSNQKTYLENILNKKIKFFKK